MVGALLTTNLTHHFLIAMPGLQDAMFARSVVYVCEHSDRGTLGLVINKPGDLELGQLFEKVQLPLPRAELARQPVFQGGPVQTERGFVLHELFGAGSEQLDAVFASTLKIANALEMTTSKDVLEAVAAGGGPRRLLVTLGYSAWAQGQLEAEISDNAWLTVPAQVDLIFETPVAERYEQALQLLGIAAGSLALQAGHA